MKILLLPLILLLLLTINAVPALAANTSLSSYITKNGSASSNVLLLPDPLNAGQSRVWPLDSSGYPFVDAGGGTVTVNPVVVTPTDRGGTITTGGTAQSVMVANSSRKGCWIQNPVNATEDLYVSSTSATPSTTAGAPDDADLAPGMGWSCTQNNEVIQTAVYAIAATTGHAFIAKEVQ